MQLWEFLVVGCLNVVSALDKNLQQYSNSSSSGASGIQTDGALPSHDSSLVSFNIIVGTVNIASSFTRFFGAVRLWLVGVVARPGDITCRAENQVMQLRCRFRLMLHGVMFCWCLNYHSCLNRLNYSAK
jgi:hypothetical protein